MDSREALKQNSMGIAAIAVVVLVLVSIGFAWSALHRSHQAAVAATRINSVFYSDDDGKTWFLDDVSKGTPFDHNGTQAYRALVFRIPGGSPFVAYLARFSDQQKALPQTAGEMPQEIKKPGDTKWAKAVRGYPPVQGPDGTDAVPVSPFDPDNGATNN